MAFFWFFAAYLGANTATMINRRGFPQRNFCNPKMPLLVLLMLAGGLLPCAGIAQSEEEKKELSLSDIWVFFRFMPTPVSSIQWMQNDSYFSELTSDNHLLRYQVENPDAEPDTLVNGNRLKYPDNGRSIGVESYEFGPNERYLLLRVAKEKIYRRSYTVRAYVYDVEQDTVHAIYDGERLSYATFSPKGDQVAFVSGNNLYFQKIGSPEWTQVTADGKKNHIINGSTDWVYEEEFAITKAFWWSPDSRYLAFLRFDESDVREFSMPKYTGLYPELYTFKYPKAGEDNSEVSLHLYDLETRQTREVDMLAEEELYLPRLQWVPGENRLAILRMNRHQNKMQLALYDPKAGNLNIIHTETSETYVDEPHDHTIVFLPEGEGFLIQSERSGYNHIYRYDLKGRLQNPVTEGEWEVSEVFGADTENGWVYFTGTREGSTERHIYRVQLNGKKLQQLSEAPGWHSPSFSSAFSYYLDTYSTAEEPPLTSLYEADGDKMRDIVKNEHIREALQKYELPQYEFLQIPGADNTPLNAWMLKPTDFSPDQTYPVLMFTYGGPGSQQVKNKFNALNGMWHRYMAQQGYIVVCVDNRGTGGRGRDFQKQTYLQLGKIETQDQIAAARWLGEQAYADRDKIAIWGWSYGGYLSSLCILLGSDVFNAAVAVAPVTNWRFYDTIYTERYMRTPQENADGYDDNSPLSHVGKLEGAYLLIHGTADDNVHYQNAMEMTNALVQRGKEFETFFYPNRDHGIYGGGARFHLFRKITQFLQQSN